MKRIADEDQCRDLQALSCRQRTHPPSQRPSTDRQSPDIDFKALGERCRGVADGLNAHFWWVSPTTGAILTGKSNPFHGHANLGGNPVHFDQLGLIPVPTNSRRHDETYR